MGAIFKSRFSFYFLALILVNSLLAICVGDIAFPAFHLSFAGIGSFFQYLGYSDLALYALLNTVLFALICVLEATEIENANEKREIKKSTFPFGTLFYFVYSSESCVFDNSDTLFK